MNASLVEMFRYNRWANLALLEACRSLTDEQLDARMPCASGSVRELLLHIVGGQQTFVLRTMGRQHEGELNRGSAWPGHETLLELAAKSSDDLIAIAAAMDDESTVVLPWQGAAFRFPRRFFLVHAMEHGVEHRTEVKLALAGLAFETPDLDAWNYSAFAGFGQEVSKPVTD